MEKSWHEDCGKCRGKGYIVKVNGEWLKARRDAADVSLRELGKALGFSAMFLSDIEHNRRNCSEKVLKAYEGLKKP